MLPDIARFLPRLANDQIVGVYLVRKSLSTHGNAIKIFCYQMFLASTFANLFFRCVHRNGDFGTDFTVNLHHDQRGVFHHRFLSATGHGALSISPSPFSSCHSVKQMCGVNGLSIRTTASSASCIRARSCSPSVGAFASLFISSIISPQLRC